MTNNFIKHSPSHSPIQKILEQQKLEASESTLLKKNGTVTVGTSKLIGERQSSPVRSPYQQKNKTSKFNEYGLIKPELVQSRGLIQGSQLSNSTLNVANENMSFFNQKGGETQILQQVGIKIQISENQNRKRLQENKRRVTQIRDSTTSPALQFGDFRLNQEEFESAHGDENRTIYRQSVHDGQELHDEGLTLVQNSIGGPENTPATLHESQTPAQVKPHTAQVKERHPKTGQNKLNYIRTCVPRRSVYQVLPQPSSPHILILNNKKTPQLLNEDLNIPTILSNGPPLNSQNPFSIQGRQINAPVKPQSRKQSNMNMDQLGLQSSPKLDFPITIQSQNYMAGYIDPKWRKQKFYISLNQNVSRLMSYQGTTLNNNKC